MPQRNTKPMLFQPRGLYDALDGTNAPKGSCFSLQNLIHDVTTERVWTPRPGAVALTTFGGFNTPGYISCMFAVGTKIFGLIKSNRNPGNDEPFCYDTLTHAFVTVSNITAANTPTSPASSGAWTPPTMDLVGSRLIVTHPGFAGGGGGMFFGWFDFSGANISVTGNTHSNTTIDNISSMAGIVVGLAIAGSGIPINTYVTSVNVAGSSITISNPSSTTLVATPLTITGGTLAAPTWGAGNTQGTALPSVPVAVKNFNNRAYYACVNLAYFSDSSIPVQITNATQAVTCGDSSTPIVGFGTLPLIQTTGGILAGLIIFKTAGGYWQVTGDIALNNLVLNGPVGSVGCAAPRTVVQTPGGLMFMAEDGVRVIDFSGIVRPDPMPGVRYPFDNAIVPSRAAAAYNATVYRISLQTIPNTLSTTVQNVDYWYDFEINEWGGPHTCAYDCITPLLGTFVFSSPTHQAAIYQSDTLQVSSSVFTEFGSQLTFLLQSSIFSEDDGKADAIVFGTVDLALTAVSQAITVQIVDEVNGVIGQVIVMPPGGTTVWGNFLWGGAPWQGVELGLRAYNLDWKSPIVYRKAAIALSGNSSLGARIGNAWLNIEVLGYYNVQNPE